MVLARSEMRTTTDCDQSLPGSQLPRVRAGAMSDSLDIYGHGSSGGGRKEENELYSVQQKGWGMGMGLAGETKRWTWALWATTATDLGELGNLLGARHP